MAAPLQAQEAYYDQRWAEASDSMNPTERERAEIALVELRRFAQQRAPGSLRILEIGCGRGLLSAELAEFGSVVGLDLSPKATAAAAERWASLPITFAAGDFLTMDLEGGFDFICSMEVIEHVEDQTAFADRLAELLAPGGVAVVSTPNRWVIEHWSRTPGAFLQPVENWRNASELRALFERKLTITSCRSFCFNQLHIGLFRLLNSPKLNQLLPLQALEERLDWGMHLALVARK